MLRNDPPSLDKDVADRGNTRALQNAVLQHHKNNPHVSMEAAFEYVMLNSATFQALPTAYIEKAREYLDLPTVGIKPKEVTSECKPSLFLVTQDEITPIGWECNELPTFDIRVELESMGIPSSDEKGDPDMLGISIPRLNKDRLAEFINRVTRNVSTHESIGHTFGRIRRESAEFMQMHPIDIHNAWTQLTEIQAKLDPSIVGPKPNSFITKVHAERVVVDNRKMIEILKFENVRKARTLPEEYVYGMPRFYESNDGVVFARFENPSTIIKAYHPGNVITQTEFGQMIKTMKEAGVRLSKINKTAKLEREHSGKFTVSV